MGKQQAERRTSRTERLHADGRARQPTFTTIENGELRTLVLPIRDRYETIFRFTPFAVRLRIGFSGWELTWEVTALRRLENSLEIDLGLRIS